MLEYKSTKKDNEKLPLTPSIFNTLRKMTNKTINKIPNNDFDLFFEDAL